MIIKMDIPFGEGNFVSKRSLKNLEYNSMIEVPNDAFVIVDKESERCRFELSKSEGVILNSKPRGIGNLFKKIDSNKYTIYFVSTAKVEGKYGGNFNVRNLNISELEYEKIFYQVEYWFKVQDSKRLIENFISEDFTHYSRDYFRGKIGKQIQAVIEEVISLNISKNGLANFSNNSTNIIKEIENKLNDENYNFSWDAGIKLGIIKLNVSEDDKIKSIKEDSEIRKYQKKMAKDSI